MVNDTSAKLSSIVFAYLFQVSRDPINKIKSYMLIDHN